jgi:hypothetical protein
MQASQPLGFSIYRAQRRPKQPLLQCDFADVVMSHYSETRRRILWNRTAKVGKDSPLLHYETVCEMLSELRCDAPLHSSHLQRRLRTSTENSRRTISASGL